MFGKQILRKVHYAEYHGNIYVGHWVHVPAWNIYGAEKTYSEVLESFEEVQMKFPQDRLHIGDFCSVSCKNTMHVITKLVTELRTTSDREVVVSPTLLPMANWNDYFKLALSPEYYGGLSNTFVMARPAYLWKRIFPNEFLHFIYANHSFMPISKMPVAEDTVWPTLSQDPQVKQELLETATRDLDNLLTLRSQELKKGGRFCFDILLDHEVPLKSPWRLLSDIVEEFVAQGKIHKEERSKMAVRNYQRTRDLVDSVLEKHSQTFRVVEKQVVCSRFPAYAEFQKDKDAQKLAWTYSDWLKEWTAPAIMMNLAQTRSQDEKVGIVKEIYEELAKRSAQDPIPLDVELYDIILERIN